MKCLPSVVHFSTGFAKAFYKVVLSAPLQPCHSKIVKCEAGADFEQ